MPKPPRRFKTIDELTPAEHLEHQRSGTFPETDEYREYRREVLSDAGLEDETGESADVPLAEMTPAQHHEAIKRN